MDGTGTANRANPKRVPKPHPKMERETSPPTTPFHHSTQPQTLACTTVNGYSPKRPTKEGHSLHPTWPIDGWTPGQGRNHPRSVGNLLVARNERVDHQLRKRMRNLPVEQEPHEEEVPLVPHPSTPVRTPLQNSRHGSNHPTPQKRRQRRHLNDC
jgi:hypothetical protein